MRLFVLPMTVGCLFVFAGSAMADTKAEIMEKLVGRWTIDEGTNMGKEIPEEELEGSITVITADTITTYDREENVTYQAKYTLNVDVDPMQIDMVSIKNGQETKALGIIEFEWLDLDGENEFSLAYSLQPGERPTEFESPEGSQIMVMELEEAEID